MKSIVIISPYFPWPLQSGGNVGVFYMLSSICKQINVTFISCYNKHNTRQNLSVLKQKLPEVNFRIYDYRKALNRKYELAKKVSRAVNSRVCFCDSINKNEMDISREITPDFIRFINDVIEDVSGDIVQIEFYEYLPLVFAIPDSVKKIFVHHELRYVVYEQRIAPSVIGDFFKKYSRKIEIALLNEYDVVVSLTDVDKEKLENEGVVVPIHTSTLMISDETPKPKDKVFNGRLTFVGGDGHSPNVDGVYWFLDKIYPMVLLNNPDVIFEIIGKWSSHNKRIILNKYKNIEFSGFVEDLSESLDGSILIVPIRIGSGMRMKILEAASNSTPLVTTTVGVEGLNFENNKDCLIADVPQVMAKRITDLIQDSQLYTFYSKNIYMKFLARYSKTILTEDRMKVYK